MTDFNKNIEQFIIDLHKINGVKFGDFKLKSGIKSPIYFDLRMIVSYPKLMTKLSNLLTELIKNSNLCPDLICGVPYTALPIATLVSTNTDIPMVIRRKEQKNYGTARMIEGEYKTGQSCIIIEDVISTGSSILETAKDLEKAGLVVKDAVVVLDRGHGAIANLQAAGITTHVLFSLKTLMSTLVQKGSITQQVVVSVDEFIKSLNSNSVNSEPTRYELTFTERAKTANHPTAKKLFELMEEKKSLLCLAADVSSADELLKVAEETGPYLAVLKTHVDAVRDFSEDVALKLSEIATRHNFLLMEDRKFADIGNTVRLQYLPIGKWAKLVTAHSIAGPEILSGLKKSSDDSPGVFLVAELSCRGSLTTPEYAKETIEMAERNQDTVVGVVCQSKNLLKNPGQVQLTPGVRFKHENDELGQQYVDPSCAILEKGADLVVVGRGILEAADRVKESEKYQKILYEAYKTRTSAH